MGRTHGRDECQDDCDDNPPPSRRHPVDHSKTVICPTRLCLDHVFVLQLFVDGATEVDPNIGSLVLTRGKRVGVYKVIITDGTETSWETNTAIGNPAPVWKRWLEMKLDETWRGEYMNLEVIDVHCGVDPQTSTGKVVMGRGRFMLPMKVDRREQQRVNLVRLVGQEGLKVVGFAYLTLQVIRVGLTEWRKHCDDHELLDRGGLRS